MISFLRKQGNPKEFRVYNEDEIRDALKEWLQQKPVTHIAAAQFKEELLEELEHDETRS